MQNRLEEKLNLFCGAHVILNEPNLSTAFHQSALRASNKAMFSLFMELLERSNAPFVEVSSQLTFNSDKVFQDDDYFPALQTGRHRRCYSADTIKSSKICTKRGTAHSTLLPGIFTLFCGHGL